MALAVTHVIIALVLVDLIRHYVFGKHHFPRYLIIIGGIAGLLPDIDVPLSWLFNLLTGKSVNLHGTFTHSLVFPLLLILATIILYFTLKNKVWFYTTGVIAFGWFLHLVLDCLYGGYKTFFWPLMWSPQFCPQWGISTYAVSIDAIILILWLVHEELHHYIKEYY